MEKAKVNQRTGSSLLKRGIGIVILQGVGTKIVCALHASTKGEMVSRVRRIASIPSSRGAVIGRFRLEGLLQAADVTRL